jgi:raffinose/stachyose/melibiose transport system substrate-binding protein
MFRTTAARRRRRRAIPLLAATVTAATLGVTGCGSSSSGSGPTVTVWSWRSQDAPVWKTVQQDLAKQGTDVQINFRAISATSYDSVLKTAMNGGSGPDILYDRAGNGTQTYAAAKLIQPLDGIADTSTISKDALTAAQYKGKTYGVPFAVQTMSLLYNKKILKDNGITPPQTWGQLLAAMQKLKGKGVTPMYVMGVQQWLLALQIDAIAASSMDDATTKAITDKKEKYNNAQYIAALKAFQQLKPYLESNWQATGSTGNEQETSFALGKTAFIIDGIFDTAAVNQVNPSLDYGQMLMPSPNGQQPKVDWYPDGDLSMNAKIGDSATKKATQKVLAFTTTKAFGNALSNVAGEISPISGVQVPSKYPLSVQAATWYKTQSIKPIFGIRSPMDSPNPDPASLKKTAATTPGIFTAEQNIAVPLLEGKMTPQQAASKVDSTLSWYFGK